MGVDYYNVLKLEKNASDEEVKKAYRRLAMRWHPDKHGAGDKDEAEAKFKQISEAYDVLCDPVKRQIYDLHGRDALNSGQFNPPSSGGGGGGGGGGGSGFRSRDAEVIFEEFFSGGVLKEKIGKGNGGGGGGVGNGTVGKGAAVENKLVCKLEELYKGAKRKMKISRTVMNNSGKPVVVEEVLAIDIKPGWKKGTKITFPDKGNEEKGNAPGDLIFVIDEKPHPMYKRSGNDLVFHQRVSLLEALTGKTLNITTLDGRNLTIAVTDVIKPGHEMVIPNEGMPVSKEPTKKGNLRIKFDIKFPSRLSAEQKNELKLILGGN